MSPIKTVFAEVRSLSLLMKRYLFYPHIGKGQGDELLQHKGSRRTSSRVEKGMLKCHKQHKLSQILNLLLAANSQTARRTDGEKMAVGRRKFLSFQKYKYSSISLFDGLTVT